jgi:drug/metabolite transporter (DMT)-like permease
VPSRIIEAHPLGQLGAGQRWIQKPFIAALLGAVFLGERLGPQAIAGGACILLGALLILRAQR